MTKGMTILISLFVLIMIGCNPHKGPSSVDDKNPLHKAIAGMDPKLKRWGSWNVLFKPNTSPDKRAQAIIKIEDALLAQIRSNPAHSSYTIQFELFYCPCDTLLYNLGATLLDGSGTALISPPPPPPPGGSGDVVLISYNNPIVETDTLSGGYALDTTKRLQLSDSTMKTKFATQTLAIIDTGIDTLRFSPEIRQLMQDQSMYNITSPATGSFFDDHPQKHGTVVTAIALQALMDRNKVLTQNERQNNLPKLMILKALDHHKRGTTFTVSCALSYAVQNDATAINASLGYFDDKHMVDSVLHHYVQLASQKNIYLFAAAGNLNVPKVASSICREATAAQSLLKDDHRFFPACFSPEFSTLFSVTSLTNPGASCFYQNYSPEYISMGVIQTNSHCCHFTVPFASAEGTSFATPVACGTALSYLVNNKTITDFSNFLTTQTTPMVATKAGKYMEYSSPW